MTAAADTAVPSTWHSRTEADLTAQRLEAMGRFHEARRAAERGAQVATRSRELRMDTARRMEVLRREHAALVDKSADKDSVDETGEYGFVVRAACGSH